MNGRSKMVFGIAIIAISTLALFVVRKTSHQLERTPNITLSNAAAKLPQNTKPEPTTSAKRMEGVELTARLEKPSQKFFDSLKPITIVLVLKNNRNRSLEFIETASLRDFDLKVRDSYGNEIPATRYGKSSSEVSVSSATRRTSLQHGDAMQFAFALNRSVDMSVDSVYFATIRRSFSSEGKSGYAESNAVRIVVASTDPAMVGTITRAGK